MSTRKSKTTTAKKADVLDAVESQPAPTPITTEVTETTQPQVSTEGEAVVTKKLGRPPVPGSKRQLAIAEREAKLASGELKRGRKANPDSKRQARIKHLAEMKEKGLLTGKKGRPVVPGSKHQQKLAEKQARIDANGGVPMKPGRPKMTDEQKAAAKQASAVVVTAE